MGGARCVKMPHPLPSQTKISRWNPDWPGVWSVIVTYKPTYRPCPELTSNRTLAKLKCPKLQSSVVNRYTLYDSTTPTCSEIEHSQWKWHMALVRVVGRRGQWKHTICIARGPFNLKQTKETFHDFWMFWWHWAFYLMPVFQDLVMFVLTTTMTELTDYFTPCTCQHPLHVVVLLEKQMNLVGVAST